MLEAVAGGSIADQAGLRGEDLLLRIDGQVIESGEKLERYVHAAPSGRILVLELLRQNRPLTLRLTAP